MDKKTLRKPVTTRTKSLKDVAIYEELMGSHEAKTSGCKSKCPAKCAACRSIA